MEPNTFRVTLLGTGIPDPKPDRYGSSTLVEAGGDKFVFDCGRGALQRISETGVPIKEANKLFLTHLHSDHTVGIPDLWLTPWIFGRWETPFRVWGPPGTEKMMKGWRRPLSSTFESVRSMTCSRRVAKDRGDRNPAKGWSMKRRG